MQVSPPMAQGDARPSAGETATTLVATKSASVGSVRMTLVGIGAHTESVAPYVLFGDTDDDFAAARGSTPASTRWS